jgi:hypothetical protein
VFPLVFAFVFSLQLGPIAPDAPAREPQMVANGSTVGMVFGAGRGIYFSASYDSGKTFAAPVKVAGAEVIPLSRHRGPHIAFSGGATVVTAVVGSKPAQEPHGHGLPSDGDLIAWRSIDSGNSWSAAVAVNDVPGSAREGLHSLAADAKGKLFAVWLDKRVADGTSLYGAGSTDGGATWSKNVRIYASPDGTICQCCHPSLAIDPNGQIVVMWRNCLAGNRDMYIARSRDGVIFSKGEKIGTDSWQLNACPMDGGGLAVFQNRVITAWRREGTVYMAEPGRRETALGQGKDVAVAAGASGPYVAWVSARGIEVRTPESTERVRLSEKGAFPALASLADGTVLAAWEEDGGIRTRRLN